MAFTLVELVLVMLVMITLAGLVLATSNYVQDKGKRSRAEVEIAALSAALESYKADNGSYPYSGATNTLASDQTDATANTYKAASLDLYKALSGDQDANGATDAGQRSYFSFKPQMLSGTRDASGNFSSITYIRDPFGDRLGNSYGYSTSKNATANPNYATATGNNPTFDLWSTSASTDSSKWIKNW